MKEKKPMNVRRILWQLAAANYVMALIVGMRLGLRAAIVWMAAGSVFLVMAMMNNKIESLRKNNEKEAA